MFLASKLEASASSRYIKAQCDEPIANEEWVQNYLEKKEKEKAHVNAMQERLDEKIPITDW